MNKDEKTPKANNPLHKPKHHSLNQRREAENLLLKLQENSADNKPSDSDTVKIESDSNRFGSNGQSPQR